MRVNARPPAVQPLPEGALLRRRVHRGALVGRCRLTPIEARVESAWFQSTSTRLKLKHVEPLSKIAFEFNVRPYALEPRDGAAHAPLQGALPPLRRGGGGGGGARRGDVGVGGGGGDAQNPWRLRCSPRVARAAGALATRPLFSST
jgi:hypothetical protein